ncbi:MAG: enoyl-CoA hydratase/isomerase family protein [Gemmatimonadota bacterium]
MIQVREHGQVAVVRLEHGKANVIDVEFCREVVRCLRELRAPAVIVTGRASIFSAGVDLLRVLEEGPPYVRGFLSALDEFCDALFGFSRPLVAAVNGHAIAGGCVMACMADHRIMARGDGRIGVPELLVGVPFPPAPLEVMRFAVPRRHLAQVLYGGRTYGPEAARERGLVEEVVEPDRLIERSLDVAGRLATVSGEAFRLTKAQLRAPARARIRAAGREFSAEIEAAWTAPETMAAIRDYVRRTFKKDTASGGGE